MNKTDLKKALSARAELSVTAVERVLDEYHLIIAEQVSKDEEVSIANFGKFKKKITKARTGRNPQTGEQIQINEKISIQFTPAKTLRNSIAGN